MNSKKYFKVVKMNGDMGDSITLLIYTKTSNKTLKIKRGILGEIWLAYISLPLFVIYLEGYGYSYLKSQMTHLKS